ncbi:GNAT family N-acetyltransferase [Metabacillus bambusae]|uniref:GNAT family N-acetyltransferase n=1 Tax=Metabacillus bambusae TaxID=2795218 RepID=A0ABS3N7U7_9BACI|nr:GNAT family N-acetyltransferase [Metabacillus bambusae]MBO1514365.1 GNAT family N-acetyltransferase [Metabacillus bambusae]
MEIRQLEEHERQAAIELSDKTFRNHEQKSMGEAFPFMFSQSSIGQSFGAFHNGELVSFMGLVPSIIKIGEARLNVYSLGSVCTAEDYREKGIASQILERVFDFLDCSDASILLVSGDRSLYTRVNCCHFGNISKFNVQFENVHKNSESQIREMRKEDLFQMNQIAQRRLITYDQSVSDLQSLIHAEAYASCLNLTHKTLIVEKDNKVSSFLVLGVPHRKRQEQKGKMIEWAGKPNEIKHLLSYAIKAYELEEIEVAVPWHEHLLENELNGSTFTLEKNEGTVYIINPKRFLKQLNPYIKSRHLESFECKYTDREHIQVTFSNMTTTLQVKDFVSFVFDSQSNDSEILELQKSIGNIFPIPFPYTAGLNFI